MVSYVDIIGLCHSVEFYVMRPRFHVRWLRLHFKRMLILRDLVNRLWQKYNEKAIHIHNFSHNLSLKI